MIPIRATITVHADPSGFAAEYGEPVDALRMLEFLTNDLGETLRGGLSYAAALADVHVSAEIINDGNAHLYTDAQVAGALNQAADDILEAVSAGDEGLRDGLNLMANATAHYLRHGDQATLHAAIEASYDDDPAQILSWVATGV
ncbi:hypothetical protein [Krasilnikovia sp. MM14-A1259]|uniref:hypothetical protein n=1 Tax=Krasilnikovia sp. MM14-A1259 TaxID=3373539 RepID=UPI0038239A97